MKKPGLKRVTKYPNFFNPLVTLSPVELPIYFDNMRYETCVFVNIGGESLESFVLKKYTNKKDAEVGHMQFSKIIDRLADIDFIDSYM